MTCQYVGCKNEATMTLSNGHNVMHCCADCTPAWARGQETAMQRMARERGLRIRNTYTKDANVKRREIPVTMEEARRLPNLLGKIAPAMLQAHKVYRCELAGEPVRFVLV